MATHKMPDMEYKFSIQVQGKESGMLWTGEFLYRRPTLTERGLIETTSARLNGDLRTVDPEVQDLHAALAHLRWTLRDVPEWWKNSDYGGMLYDSNVVMDIYNKCIKFEADWMKKTLGGDPKDVEEQDVPKKVPDRTTERPVSQPG